MNGAPCFVCAHVDTPHGGGEAIRVFVWRAEDTKNERVLTAYSLIWYVGCVGSAWGGLFAVMIAVVVAVVIAAVVAVMVAAVVAVMVAGVVDSAGIKRAGCATGAVLAGRRCAVGGVNIAA